MNAQYEFGILGPLVVTRDGRCVSLGAAQLRTLLAALLLDFGRVVPVDALVDRLWGQCPPPGARNAVQNYVLRLRRALGAEVVRTDRRGYALDDEGGHRLDAHRFTSLTREGAAALDADRPERALELLGDALALWRGEPLADLEPERFWDVVPVLCEQRLAAEESWIDAAIRGGRPADALPELYDRLRAAGSSTGLLVRHCEYYRALTARAAAEWCGPDEARWLERLRRELPNIRSALDFCRVRPGLAPTGAAIVVDLTRTRCWFFGSTLGEARHWIDSLSPLVDPAPGELTVMVPVMKAFVAIVQGDHAAAEIHLAECRAVAPGAPVPAPVVYIEGVYALLVPGDPASIAQLAAARRAFIAAGQTGDAHMATMFRAMAATFLGDRAEARLACDTYVAEAESAGAEWARTWAQWCTGLTELLHGEPRRGLAPLCDALVRQRALDDNWGPAWSLETLAWTLGALGHHERAAVVLGAAHRYRQVTGARITELRPFGTLHARTRAVVQEHLAAEAYTSAWQRGATAEDSITLALGIAHEVHRPTDV
ncbi:winged helix-turn-helix domain-containing protein [Streptomyces sp. NBC_01725]|uniref:AfsR/SARP family transcriptional regulator n=1 Tax=Streptomyces sp. NBC_01725 TaxID=2975923 RepID=UPI002E29C8CA|nr:BTAD domain-containing putative transcriptional regulator [Streptomyces sp. NBC_01725]